MSDCAAWFGDALLTNRRTLEIVAGVFIVFTGLIYAGVPIPLALLREKRFHLSLEPPFCVIARRSSGSSGRAGTE